MAVWCFFGTVAGLWPLAGFVWCLGILLLSGFAPGGDGKSPGGRGLSISWPLPLLLGTGWTQASLCKWRCGGRGSLRAAAPWSRASALRANRCGGSVPAYRATPAVQLGGLARLAGVQHVISIFWLRLVEMLAAQSKTQAARRRLRPATLSRYHLENGTGSGPFLPARRSDSRQMRRGYLLEAGAHRPKS